MKYCPYCKKEIRPSSHIYSCAKLHGITKERTDIKYDFISYNFNELCDEMLLRDLYIDKLYSLPMFNSEFGIDSKSLTFLLDYFNIERRGISESACKISTEKYKKTVLDRYGVDNVSKLEHIKQKKRNTILHNYGVDNIWKHPSYYKLCETAIYEKYNMTLSEFRSLKSKNVWKQKSPSERIEWLNSSIHHPNTIRKSGGYTISSLETRVSSILDELLVSYETQFYIKDHNAKCKLYDFHIKNTNILIEVQGDFWHANPKIYKQSDELIFPSGRITVRDIHSRDVYKFDIAYKNGYVVKYIWESDMKQMSDVELKNEIIKIIEL